MFLFLESTRNDSYGNVFDAFKLGKKTRFAKIFDYKAHKAE